VKQFSLDTSSACFKQTSVKSGSNFERLY